MGFDASGEYLLTISHSGRGVFSTRTWERVSRDPELVYPEGGFGLGIGPIKKRDRCLRRPASHTRPLHRLYRPVI
jgi:hypothetical protein